MKSIQYQYHIRRLMVVDVDTFQMHLVRTTTHLITTAGCCNVAVHTFCRTHFFLISLSLFNVSVFVLFCPRYLFLLFLQLLVVVVCFSLFVSFKQVLINLSAKLIVKGPFFELILFNIIILRSTTILEVHGARHFPNVVVMRIIPLLINDDDKEKNKFFDDCDG